MAKIKITESKSDSQTVHLDAITSVNSWPIPNKSGHTTNIHTTNKSGHTYTHTTNASRGYTQHKGIYMDSNGVFLKTHSKLH